MRKVINRMRKVAIALILAFVLIPQAAFAAEHTSVTEGGIEYYTYKGTVSFGSYPQTEVVYDETASGDYGKEWERGANYLVDGNLYSRLSKATWDKNNDAVIDDCKYHRLAEKDATNVVRDVNTEFYYNWGDENVRYFRYDPISWRVVNLDDSNLFVVSEKCLDTQPYSKTLDAVSWESSWVRSWLNAQFYNRAFTSEEKEYILNTNVRNGNNFEYGTKGGNDTQDRVFLLSEDDVWKINGAKNGFHISLGYGSPRKCGSTSYAKAMGVMSAIDTYEGPCTWWLRSPGNSLKSAALVYANGQVSNDGRNVDSKSTAIRPAMHINIKDNQLISGTDTIQYGKAVFIDDIKMSKEEYLFKGTAVTPKVIIDGLTEGKDFEVTYENNDAVGEAVAIATGIGRCQGILTKTFNIAESIDISSMKATLSETTCLHSGKPCTPKVTIAGLTEGSDFTVTYKDNLSAGIATATIKGINGYTGTITKSFKIVHDYKTVVVKKATTSADGAFADVCNGCSDIQPGKVIYKVASFKLGKTTYTWDGKVKTPGVTVKDRKDNSLVKGKDYTVTYASGRKNVGKYKVTVKGKGNYTFTKTLTFKINPKTTTLSSITPKTKALTVKWAKRSTQVTGYEVQYSTSGTFKAGTATKKAIVKSYKTTSKTIKSLKAKKKYYVRVRTYKTVNGVKYYSAWCTKKYVTIK